MPELRGTFICGGRFWREKGAEGAFEGNRGVFLGVFSWRGRGDPERRRLKRAEEILFGWRFIFLRSSLSSGELVAESEAAALRRGAWI